MRGEPVVKLRSELQEYLVNFGDCADMQVLIEPERMTRAIRVMGRDLSLRLLLLRMSWILAKPIRYYLVRNNVYIV